jgi:hypothetical protein
MIRRGVAMTDIQHRTAQSIVEYMSIIDGLNSTVPAGLWFRGQSNSSYRLIPSALRDLDQVTDGRGQPIQKGQAVTASGGLVSGPSPELMLAEFRRQAYPFVDRLPDNDFEWLFIAQHHGLPTRLLDWSTNALVALYFAASGAHQCAGDGLHECKEFLDGDEFRSDGFAVFVIDPCEINRTAHGQPSTVDIARSEEAWRHYLDPMSHAQVSNYSPVCVTAPHISPRIRSQSGTFTLHGSNIWPLDYYSALRPLITKIFLPNTAAKRILESLENAGVNRSFIYPGLDSIAIDVRNRHRSIYLSKTKY